MQGKNKLRDKEEINLCFQILIFIISHLRYKPGKHIKWNEDEGRKIEILTSVPETGSDQRDLCSFAQNQF